MRRIVVFNNVTLDGVMQAPGSPDEDPRDGFQFGGWGAPYAAMSDVGDALGGASALLMGRTTYDRFSTYWPKQKDSPFSARLDNMEKFVASRTLNEAIWQNTTLLKGDAAETVAKLRQTYGPGIMIMGSGVLIRSLMAAKLIDRYVLLICPLVLGTGRKLFTDGTQATLNLVQSKTTSKGVVIAVYEPATPAE
jgi:dihydrofolate reductase